MFNVQLSGKPMSPSRKISFVNTSGSGSALNGAPVPELTTFLLANLAFAFFATISRPRPTENCPHAFPPPFSSGPWPARPRPTFAKLFCRNCATTCARVLRRTIPKQKMPPPKPLSMTEQLAFNMHLDFPIFPRSRPLSSAPQAIKQAQMRRHGTSIPTSFVPKNRVTRPRTKYQPVGSRGWSLAVLMLSVLTVAIPPAHAITVTLSNAVAGKTPEIVGYNSGHFMPGSNTADWWRYSGVNGARVWPTPTTVEPSDDLAPFG